jgi:tetratricopeptide (TPR) repeat protein
MTRVVGKKLRRSALLLTCLLALLASGCSVRQVAAQLASGVRAQQAYTRGAELYHTEDYTGAIPLLAEAVSLQADFDEAEALLAWSYYHIGKYPEATRHFLRGIARRPTWEGLHNGLGWSRYQVGRYSLALEAFRQALALDKSYRDAGVGYAYTLFELGRYAEVLSHLERLTREGEGGAMRSAARDVESVRSRYAWTLFYLGDYPRAREQFARGVAARPEWSGLHNGLGWTLLRQGDKAAARRSFERALELKPDLVDAREGLTQVGR